MEQDMPIIHVRSWGIFFFSAQSICQKCWFVYAEFGKTPEIILVRG